MLNRLTLKTGLVALAFSLATAACSGSGDEDPNTVRIYTSVTQDTVDAVVDGFRLQNPGTTVEVFRAPTGELAARIAAEQRTDGVYADVFWLTDPISMYQYEADGLLLEWRPQDAGEVPQTFQTPSSWGTRILTLVAVHGLDVPVPATWWDLAGPAYTDAIGIPDPGFAGSALAALGFFALDERFGFEFYESLAANGATQVSSPGEVVTGVAEGRFSVGITLAQSANLAAANGSPIGIARPEPGGIAVYSPVAVLAGSPAEDSARGFVDYLLSKDGQERIAQTGWQPIRADVPWADRADVVLPDWAVIIEQRDSLLGRYRTIFEG